VEKKKKYIVQRSSPHMTMWRKRSTCWITEATNARTEDVILTAFQLQ